VSEVSGNYYPTPPPKSPWSSPVVIGAIVAGALVLALAVLLGFLFIPEDDNSATTSSTSATPPPNSTETVTATAPTAVSSSTPPPTTTTTRPTATPDVPGADSQGFLSGPRCNAAGDPAVMVGQTARSKVVVCQVGDQSGRYYYKGLAGEGAIEIQYPTRSGNSFTAINNDTTYLVDASSLTISTNGSVLTAEPMIYYWVN
jgi:hypothetical protein